MINWKNLFLLFSLAVNIAAAATLAYFWGRHDEMRRLPALLQRPDRTVNSSAPLWKTMGLRHSQREELAKLRAPFNERMRSLRLQLQANRHRLMQLLLMNPTAADSIQFLLRQMAEDQTQLDRSTVEHLLKLRPHLDERQWRLMVQALDRERHPSRGMRRPGPFKRIEP
ncbi:periplasmic heavy metal sensor [bacterium]|nr:periplasmic heavy metal sensor [bacterium]